MSERKKLLANEGGIFLESTDELLGRVLIFSCLPAIARLLRPAAARGVRLEMSSMSMN